MNPSEYPTSTRSYRSSQELREEYLKGHPYNNTVVTTTHPDFSDAYDPNLEMATNAVVLYWPDCSPTQDDRDFEILTLHKEQDHTPDSEAAAETALIREAILGSSISKATLDRVPAEMSALWSGVKLLHTAPILFAESQCTLSGLPLALCEISRIRASSVIPVGTRVMHLWYPNYLSPKPVLNRLKRAVKSIMDQEVIADDPSGRWLSQG